MKDTFPIPAGAAAGTFLKIAGLDVSQQVIRFEWSSFVNTGYMIHGEILDPNHLTLKKLASGEEATVRYLKEGRRKPLPIEFGLGWAGGKKTDKRIAYATNLRGRGSGQNSILEFEAIDPPSFLLNAGTADGRVYEGKVSDVIERVVKDFTKDSEMPLEVAVTKTDDNPKNKFWMMRMDPKTFIGTLIDWSSSTSKDKSRWIVACKDTKINIKKESDLNGMDLGTYTVASNKLVPRDTDWWNLDLNNFISAFQTKLVTGGISAVSGRYIDPARVETAVVKDDTTSEKRSVKTGPDRAFSKPATNWATYIMPVPECNAGDVGIEYSEYVDGRARQKFINMLSLTMKIRIDVTGDARVDNSELLGVSTCFLMWKDVEDDLYFLHGNWVVYGFHHVYTARSSSWTTSLYLYRIDHDAAIKPLPAGG